MVQKNLQNVERSSCSRERLGLDREGLRRAPLPIGERVHAAALCEAANVGFGSWTPSGNGGYADGFEVAFDEIGAEGFGDRMPATTSPNSSTFQRSVG